MPRISIKTNILTIFLILIGLISFSILFSQYYFSKKLAIESTQKTFKLISKNIHEHLKQEAQHTKNILQAKSRHKDILEPITFNPFHPAIHSIIQTLQTKKNFYAMYIGHPNGNLYEVIHLSTESNLLTTFNAPKLSQWLVITIINNKIQKAFLDKNFKLITKNIVSKKYDLFTRPWYKQALHVDKVISTMPYKFTNIDEMGFTYAKELETKGVVIALDYTMKQVNSILALQKFDAKSEVFLTDKKGKKFASSAFTSTSNNAEIDTNLIQALSNKNIDTILHYTHYDNQYYSMLCSLATDDIFLGIKIDADQLLQPYKDNLEYSLFIALILLLISIPIIFISTNLIVKPIQKLILENEKIKHRNFSKVEEIETNIIEFRDLSHSFLEMSQSIQAYQKSQEEMLDSIIKLIAEAIDTKSPYTGGHCARVPEIAQLLLDEANNSNEGSFKEFSLTSKDALREFEIGAWLHDCGKVTTPEYVVDKSTKLETIYNRIHEIRMRFEVLWRDAQIQYMQELLNNQDINLAKEALHVKQAQLMQDFNFIADVNIGGEFMDENKQERVKEIASQEWTRHFDDRAGIGEVEKLRYKNTPKVELPAQEKLLEDKSFHIIERENFDYESYEKEGFKEEVPKYLYNYGEIYNLCISKGTLSTEERYKINEHVIMSIKMLEKIPFPAQLSNIPEYAGTHHETLIGTGYPRKLTKNELSIPARIMAIADIFEALTASDRPYKKAKTLSEAIKIMSFMVKDKHIDAELFYLFLSSGVYKTYAQKYLKPEQIDDVDVESYKNLSTI